MTPRLKRVQYSLLVFMICSTVKAGPLLSEGFNDVSTLAASGWVMVNNSSPLGTTGWFQGETAVFTAQSGPSDSYIATNFDNAAFGGNISNWLIAPVLTLTNGSQLTFYTRTETDPFPGDNLEVRLSTNGTSVDVGTTIASVGDFTTLLQAVPEGSGGYPTDWTQYAVAIGGLSGPTNARIGFRYVVADTSANGDYIGLDTVQVDSVPEPSTLGLALFGMAAVLLQRVCAARRG